MNSKQNSNNRKSGFTLMELLITIAVMVVLFAVSVPAVSAIKANLENKRLNDYAKEIYVAATNHTLHEVNSNTLDGLSAQETIVSRKNGMKKPGDFGSGTSWNQLSYIVSSDDALISYMLPDLSRMTIGKGAYLFEVDPVSGEIYSVFYSQGSASDLEATYLSVREGQRTTALKNAKIGYYNGKLDPAGVNKLFKPTLEVFNDEELYLKMSVANGNKDNSLQNMKYIVSLKDESGNTIQLTTANATASGQTVSYLVLDSLTSPFKNLADQDDASLKLAAGDNITAVVDACYETTYKYVPTTIECTTNEVEFNSLYADGTTDETIRVCKVRHLNNLRQENITNDKYKTVTGKTPTVKNVVQTDTIDFAGNWASKVSPLTLGSATSYSNPLSTFTPINNSAIFGSNHSDTIPEYDGKGNEIANFSISGTGNGGIGLFASTSCDLTDIHLKRAKVDGGSASNVGALVGIAGSGTISKCGSFVDCAYYYGDKSYTFGATEGYVKGGSNVGGLVGSAGTTTTITASFGALDTTGTSNVGGLVGSNSGVIDYCYSSGVVKGTTNLGGIAGLASNKIDQCYSTSDVIATVGSSGGSNTVTSGIACASGAMTISNCNYYGQLDTADNKAGSKNIIANVTIGTGNKYLEQTDYNKTLTNKNGLTGTKFETLQVEKEDDTYSHPYYYNDSQEEKIHKGDWFPFAFISKIKYHYGNWPAERAGDEGKAFVFYYERYYPVSGSGSAKYGYYAVKADGSVVNTLMSQDDLDSQKYFVEMDGYGFAVTSNLVSGTTLNFKASYDGNNLGTGNINYLENYSNFRMYSLQATPHYLSSNEKKYRKIVIKDARGNTAVTICAGFYDPDFAKTAVNYSADASAPAMPTSFIVRTARHLNTLGRKSVYWNNNLTFNQELDVDFAKYLSKSSNSYLGTSYKFTEGTYKNVPIGLNGTYFMNKYDGASYKVIDYKLSTTRSGEYFIGLFGTIKNAEIKNVIIYASNPNKKTGQIYCGNAARSNSVAVGTIAGCSVDSLIENCCSCGYTVMAYPDRDGYFVGIAHNIVVGGLVGANRGVIRNCSAIQNYVAAENIYYKSLCDTDNVAVGGIAGYDAGSIVNCYARATFNIEDAYIGVFGNSKYYYGGISAELSIDNLPSASQPHSASQNCYSICEQHTTNVTQKYAVSPHTSNCYYLKGCLTSSNTIAGTTEVTAAQLHNLALTLNQNDPNGSFGDAAYTYAYTSTGNYPFPAVVVNNRIAGDGNKRAHYGDWPAVSLSMAELTEVPDEDLNNDDKQDIIDDSEQIDVIDDDKGAEETEETEQNKEKEQAQNKPDNDVINPEETDKNGN